MSQASAQVGAGRGTTKRRKAPSIDELRLLTRKAARVASELTALTGVDFGGVDFSRSTQAWRRDEVGAPRLRFFSGRTASFTCFPDRFVECGDWVLAVRRTHVFALRMRREIVETPDRAPVVAPAGVPAMSPETVSIALALLCSDLDGAKPDACDRSLLDQPWCVLRSKDFPARTPTGCDRFDVELEVLSGDGVRLAGILTDGGGSVELLKTHGAAPAFIALRRDLRQESP